VRIGTRSLLFGVHQVLLHPAFVALAWRRLYGRWPDWRTSVAILIHDWGYWGKPNMDGPEGESHVEWAAHVMGRLFGPEWHDLCLYHSRFRALQDGRLPSRLCAADKYSGAITPPWLYLPLAWLSGELREYMALAARGKYDEAGLSSTSALAWYRGFRCYMERWGPGGPGA